MRHLLFVALVSGACATAPVAATATAAATSTAQPHQLVASLERGACNGACPTYVVRVFADGAVEFEGRRFTATKGLASDHLTAAQLAQLHEAFRAAAFDSLAPSYRDPHVADQAVITVTHGAKTVAHSTGEAQPALKALEDRLDEVLGTSRWVLGPTL
jgi:hypothetical protein